MVRREKEPVKKWKVGVLILGIAAIVILANYATYGYGPVYVGGHAPENKTGGSITPATEHMNPVPGVGLLNDTEYNDYLKKQPAAGSQDSSGDVNASSGRGTESEANAAARKATEERIVNQFSQFWGERNDYWDQNGYPEYVQIKDEDGTLDPRVFKREGYDSDVTIIGNDQGIEDYHAALIEDARHATGSRDNPIWNDMTGFASDVHLLKYWYDSDGHGTDARLLISQDGEKNIGAYEIKENDDNLGDKIKKKYLVASDKGGLGSSSSPADSSVSGTKEKVKPGRLR